MHGDKLRFKKKITIHKKMEKFDNSKESKTLLSRTFNKENGLKQNTKRTVQDDVTEPTPCSQLRRVNAAARF